MVGCDLHDRSMLIRYAEGTGKPQQRSFHNDYEGRSHMREFLGKLMVKHQAERVVVAYEASGQGYGLCDLLCDHGVEC